MRQMAEEIVGADLVGGVLAVRDQIVCPLRKQRAVFRKQLRTRARRDGGSRHDQHIAAFLDRHLVAGVAVRAVDLPVDLRIAAHVMRRKFKRPVGAFRVVQDRPEHAVYKLRVIKEVHRHTGIADIRRRGAAVGQALLRDIQKSVLLVLHQLMCRHDLPVCKRQHIRVDLAASLRGLARERLRKFPLPRAERRILGECIRNCLFDGLSAALPIGLQRLFEVFNAVDIVVSKREQRVSFRKRSLRRHKRLALDLAPAGFAVLHAEVEIAPVDARIVARVFQDRLRRAADLHGFDPAAAGHGLHRDRLLPRRIEAKFLRRAELRAKRVRVPVQRLRPERQIGDRAAAQQQIVGKNGRKEARRQADTMRLKNILRGKRRYFHGNLTHRDASGLFAAHEAVLFAVDPQHAVDGVAVARPMTRCRLVECIPAGPDAEIGIDCDQGNRRCSELHKISSVF